MVEPNRGLLQLCKVTPEHDGKLLLRKRKASGKEAWIFINPTPGDITESVNIKGWKRVEDLLNGKISLKENTLDLTVKSLDVRVLVVAR